MSDAKVKFTNVEPDAEAYALLDAVLQAHHPHLSEARIALVWAHAFKPDKDGHLVWGQVKKVSPLEQTFHEHDFVILLNVTAWDALTPDARKALIDHELCHCGSSTNDEGEVSYYCRKHDLEEFVQVVERHGLWRSGVEQLVNAAVRRAAEASAIDATPDDEEPV